MSKILASDLTPFAPDPAARLAHLERDRWPEFERELWARRPRKPRFGVHRYGGVRAPWEWLIPRCRKWVEVEKVLNRHRVAWEYKRTELVLEDATIYRTR